MSDRIAGLKTAGGAEDDAADLEIGSVVDRYTLVERIGEGGFGVVYRAEQTAPVRRDVALKVTKLGMDTKEFIARFDAERQALAVLDHPNISKVFDAGSTRRGRPYFVMELVRGVPITEYCDEGSLSLHARLALFEKVCQAVQHAHQKGIVHRDIKPTNVLVTVIDGQAIPKVIDFGIAKAIDQRLTEKTLMTEQHQMVGTPEYMAPEQADMSTVDIDTRADIYSMGVLLYELLTGSQPHDLHSALKDGFGAVIAQIREVNPPTPSTRIRQLAPGALKTVSRQRRTTSAALGRKIAGDLDWIVMKAMEKDRARRYQTADAFAQDIARHRKNEPVLARSPSTMYRIKKYIQRHRTGVVAATAVGLALAIGGVMALRGYLEGDRQLHRALAAETDACAQADDAQRARAVADERAREARAEHDAKSEALAALKKTSEDLRVADTARNEAMSKLQSSLGVTDSALKRARALGLVNASVVSESEDPMRALLLARAAVGLSDAPEVVAQLRSAIRNSRERARFEGHRKDISSLDVSPDGKFVVTSSVDFIARLWTIDGKEVDFFSHNGPVYTARFSPDGTRVVTAAGGRDIATGEFMIWNTDGERIARVTGHKGHVYRAEYSPDGKQILTSSWDGTAGLWSADGEPLATLDAAQVGSIGLRGVEGGAVWAQFSTDGERILTVCESDGTLRSWDRAGTRLTDAHVLRSGISQTRSLWFLGDDVLVVMPNAKSRLVSISGEDIATFPRPTPGVVDVAQSPDGQRIVTCSMDGSAYLWARDGTLVSELVGHTDVVTCAAVSPDGTRIATGSGDSTAHVWNQQGDLLYVVNGPPGAVGAVSFGRNRNDLFVLGPGPVARRFGLDGIEHAVAKPRALPEMGPTGLWTSRGGRFLFPQPDGSAEIRDERENVVATLRSPEGRIGWGLFSPDGEHILTGSWGGPRVRSWSRDGTLRATFDAVQGQDLAVLLFTAARVMGRAYGARAMFAGPGRVVTFSPLEGTVRFWDVDGDEEGLAIVIPGASDVAYWPKQDCLVVRTNGDQLQVMGMDGRPRLLLGKPIEKAANYFERSWQRPVRELAFAPDGSFLVSNSEDTVAQIYGSDGKDAMGRFKWRDAEFRRILVSPDSRYVLASMDDKCAYMWDLERNAPAVFRGHESIIETLVFSPEGDVIATGGRRTVRLWDRKGTLLDILGGHTGSVTAIVFSPDQKTIYTTSIDGSFRAFLRNRDDVLQLADERATRALDEDEKNRYADLLGKPGKK